MITLKNLTMRNFLSVGNVSQAVKLDNNELTLILGENLDLGGDGARNGVGKTTMIQALSYALFGNPINNIRKDNLVNRTNAKGMMVTLEFSVNGIDYKIERGRKPNVLRFYVNNEQTAKDDAQGENKETQLEIEKVIHMSADMFKHIVVLNTYTEPFLAMKSNDQRNIIEQLLGITLLSEKADQIKELMKTTKDNIQREEFRVKAVEEANKRVREQIDALKRRQTLWTKKHDDDLSQLALDYDELSKIDIVAELQAHKDLTIYNQKRDIIEQHNKILTMQTAWKQRIESEINELQAKYNQLNNIDIVAELKSHSDLTLYKQKNKDIVELTKWISACKADASKQQKVTEKLKKEITDLKDHKCYACGQDFHDDKHEMVLRSKEEALKESALQELSINSQLIEHENELQKLGELGEKPVTHYNTEAEAIKHSSDLQNLQNKIEAKKSETDPYISQITTIDTNLGRCPVTVYDTEAEAVMHSSRVESLLKQIDTKISEIDPYEDQIAEMEQQALQVIDFEAMNKMTRILDHQKFLVDLLTNKDSFVRKKIIDQNLSYLNTRLTHYLDAIGLPHQVVFLNDLSVEITELGREMDFHNLSRGEMNRVILSLSWAFRDVWENLYTPINTLFIDELLDNGTDSVGMENSLAILKDMARKRQKSIWLVSHKEELVSRVHSVLKVVKEHGFTTYNTSIDIE